MAPLGTVLVSMRGGVLATITTVPTIGKVKIVTHDNDASVYVEGGYVGPIAKAKNLPLPLGDHDVELRDPAAIRSTAKVCE